MWNIRHAFRANAYERGASRSADDCLEGLVFIDEDIFYIKRSILLSGCTKMSKFPLLKPVEEVLTFRIA